MSETATKERTETHLEWSVSIVGPGSDAHEALSILKDALLLVRDRFPSVRFQHTTEDVTYDR